MRLLFDRSDTNLFSSYFFLCCCCSNVGSNKITEMSFEFYTSGKRRESIELHDFESVIRKQTYNDESAMKYATLVTSHLISHYIPFLPLERSHVDQCTDAYLNEVEKKKYVSTSNRKRIKDVIYKSLEWWPPELRLYSASGCKQVANKVDIGIRIIS